MSADSPPDKGARHTWRERIRIFGPAVLISLLAFGITYMFVEPAPPRHLVIATGSEEGAYFHFGQLYRERLAREGIDLTVRPTAGSVENIRLLEKGTVDIAFVQGGTGTGAGAGNELRSLASLYFEPLWVFVGANTQIGRLADLRGRRVAVGVEGSGTRAISLRLLADNGVRQDTATLLPLGGSEAAQALLRGRIDAAFLIVAPSADVVRELVGAAHVRLLSFERADAYVVRYRFLSRLTLPQGAVDLAADVPPVDTTLVAPAATLVVRKDFHPALSDLFLRVANAIHSEPGLFETAGEFPSRQYLEFPISDDARRYFQSGPPFLQRFMPFWAATLVDRLKIMLLPLITLIYPLFKAVPPAYRWRMRRRINRWYRDLDAAEHNLKPGMSDDEVERQLAELDRIEQNVRQLSVPLSYADSVYTLRLHIALLRDELREASRPEKP